MSTDTPKPGLETVNPETFSIESSKHGIRNPETFPELSPKQGLEIVNMLEGDDSGQIMTIDGNELQMGEVIAIGDNYMQEVEYVEAEEVFCENIEAIDGHTIILHDGKQYLIPNALSDEGRTIVIGGDEGDEYMLQTDGEAEEALEAEDALEAEEALEAFFVEDEADAEYADAEFADADQTQQIITGLDDDCYIINAVTDVDDMNEVTFKDQQYAIIKDGKIHIESSIPDSSSDNIQQKLEPVQNAASTEITGRNLITGQTISINGFLEKIKQKSEAFNTLSQPESDCYPETVRRKRRSFYKNARKTVGATQRPDYVLVPPVNKRVVVGKTTDGRNVVGKILQIQKKITAPVAVTPKQRRQSRKPVETQVTSKTSLPSRNVIVKKKYVSKAFLDQNIVRTLSGLMDMETIERNLAGKNLIIKHVLKRSENGRILSGKQITYYYGHMEKTETVDCFNEPRTAWLFVSNGIGSDDEDEDEPGSAKSNRIDLAEDSDSQQVDDAEDVEAGKPQSAKKVKWDSEESVTLNLIVIQDEHGKKRTKVMIPQLASSGIKCSSCPRTFRSEQQARRHVCNPVVSESSYTCELCKRTFVDMNALFRHSRTHRTDAGQLADGQRAGHACPVCGKLFNTVGSLKRHVTVHDPSLRPLQCMACLQRFTDESSLKKHMLLHTGIKAFRCEVCFKCFVHQGDLNFHRKIHDPVKRYMCGVCGKDFNRYSNMVRHADIHRRIPAKDSPATADEHDVPDGGGTDESPFTCDRCGSRYNFMSTLTRHIVSHHLNKELETAETLTVEGT